MKFFREGGSTPEEPKKETLMEAFRKNKSALIVALAASFLPGPGRGEQIDKMLDEPTAVTESADRLTMQKSKVNASAEKNWQSPEIYTTFFSKNAEGGYDFNYGALLFPVQLEFTRQSEEKEKIIVEVDQKWAQFFKTAEPCGKDDYSKAAEYVAQQIEQQLVNEVHGFQWSEKISNARKPSPKPSGRVTRIEATGVSSPEARKYGEHSLKFDSLEEENLDLARMRAEKGVEVTTDELEKLGFDTKNLDEPVVINAKESQFSVEEFKELEKLAADYQGATPLESIMKLVNDFNDNKIKDAKVIEEMDDIFKYKRMVIVEVDTEDQGTEKYLVPLPWIALLPFFRRKKKEQEPPVQIEDERRIRTLRDDLYVYFDDPDCKRRGLDYRAITEGMKKDWDEYDDDQQRLEVVNKQILEQWRIHDINARKEANMSDTESGLDYENQPEQVAWANTHGEVILDLIKEKMGIEETRGDQDYTGIMANWIRKAEEGEKKEE